jgi:FkbM family methyltransferase
MRLNRLHHHIALLKDSRLGLIDKFKLHFGAKAKTVRFKGKMLNIGSNNAFLGMYREIFLDENYAFTTNNNEPFILDCGSNIGLAILYYLDKYPKAKIVGFEPDEKAFRNLSHNLSHISSTQVEIRNQAIWIEDKELSFNAKGGTAGNIDTEGSIKVEGIRLKNILEKYPKIDFLKIDIEGAELALLQDCAQSLANVHQIFIEYHSFQNQPQKLDSLLRILTNAGFRYHIKEAFTSAFPYKVLDIQEGMDLQLNIFGYRV